MAEDVFDCAHFVKQRYPDDIGQWPEMNRMSAFAARDRLLAREPGLTVVAERSYCIDSSHARWPVPLPLNLQQMTHALLYEVRLSSPIEVGDDQEG